MRLDEFSTRSVLTELDWSVRSPLAAQLKKYVGQNLWVHFTDIEKIGVNPRMVFDPDTGQMRRGHEDAPGVYLYPVDFLFRKNANHGEEIHHGMSRAFFFICSVDPTDQLVLPTLTTERVHEIAAMNGFDEYLQQTPIHDPAEYFWRLVKHLANTGLVPWSQSLRGFKTVFDYEGIIYSTEKEQILVRDRSVMRVVSLEKNKDVSQNRYTVEYWKSAIINIFGEIAKDYDGHVYWFEKQPRVQFLVDGVEFTFLMNDYSAIFVHYTKNGRDYNERLDDVDLEEMNIQQAVEELKSIVADVTRRAAA